MPTLAGAMTAYEEYLYRSWGDNPDIFGKDVVWPSIELDRFWNEGYQPGKHKREAYSQRGRGIQRIVVFIVIQALS